jgi:hypothetical protein
MASSAKNAEEVRDKIIWSIMKDGFITAVFEHKVRANVTYLHRNHTKQETR